MFGTNHHCLGLRGVGGKWLCAALLIAAALAAAGSPAAAQDATWLASPGSGDFNTGANWSTATVPTGTAFFGTSSTTSLSVSVSQTLTFVGGWTFNAGASNYTFTNGNNVNCANCQQLYFTGAGIVVNGGSAAIINDSALYFSNASTAGSATITNANGLFFNDTSTAGSAVITNAALMEFFGGTAGSATITNNGNLYFWDTSTAGSAAITNNSNLYFEGTSTAGSANITNNSALSFNNTSSAGNANATITNNSVLNFNDTSTAGSATITNNAGTVSFNGTSTAGNATITNTAGYFGTLNFNDTSTAGSATIANNGELLFYNTSTAGSAAITNNDNLVFHDTSTAGSAAITNNDILIFFGTSTAGSAAITNNFVAVFYDTSTGGNAAITNNANAFLDFSVSTGPLGNNKLTVGSIAGAGLVFLGANELTIGGNNLSTTVSGAISDCGDTGFNCTGVIFPGRSTSGGSLVKTGTGTLTLSGANIYTGGTTISGGTLLLSGVGTLGALTGTTIVNSGGTLDLGGTTQTQAALTLNGGTLKNGNLNAPVTSSGGTINGLGGSASLTTTSGTTTLTGTNTFASTTVNGGILDVIGTLSDPTINSGGTLTGTGSVGATQVNAGGIFAPGNGTPGSSMTVTGNLAFQSGAIYLVQVNPMAASFATVTGTATLGGASVNAVFAGGSYVSKQYKILTASGGVSGTFGSLVNTNLPANFHTTLSYDANDAYLNLVLNFAIPGGLNGNQKAVGNALTNFFNTTGGIPLIYSALTANGLTQASGESATGSQQTTFQAMSQFMGVMTDPFAGRGGGINGATAPTGYAEEGKASAYAASKTTDAFAMFTKAPSPSQPSPASGGGLGWGPRWSVWASGFGGSQSTIGNAALGSNDTTSRIAGTAVGADYLFSPNTLAGFALAGGGTSFSVNNLGGGRSDLFQAGAYVRHTSGPAYITGALAYGWQDITTNRTVTIAGLDQLRAEFNANAYSGRVEGGYRFVAPATFGIGITPYAAGQFTTFDLPAYAEQAVAGSSAFALAYGAQSITDARTELGIRTDKSFIVQNGVLTLRSRLAWAHDYDPNRAVAATFQALPGASFVVNGAAQASDSALTTVSAEMKWKTGWSAAATFEGEFSNVTRSYAGKGVVRYVW